LPSWRSVGLVSERGKTDYTVRSLARGLDLLLKLQEPPHRFRPADFERHLGTSRNAVFRLLRTLQSRGFVQRIGDLYGVGMRVFSLGQLAGHEVDALRSAALPVAHDLQRASDETVTVYIRDGNEALCVVAIESTQELRVAATVGSRYPLNAGGPTKLLLAYLPEESREAILSGPLAAVTARTLVDPAALRERTRLIRARGYEFSSGETFVGSTGFAAPIRDASGSAIAALGLSGPEGRLAPIAETRLLPLVLKAAAEISARLGFRDALPDPEV